jgi:hypothetical protein
MRESEFESPGFTSHETFETKDSGEAAEVFQNVLRQATWVGLLMWMALPALGQTAQISGQVTDPQNAAVGGADVHAINEDSQVRIDGKTNAAGNFKLSALPTGRYLISIEATGFDTFTSAEINLEAGKAEVVNAQLTLPTVKEETSVTSGGAAQIELENAQLSGTITQKEVTTYGLNGRNFSQLIALAPGVSNQTGQDEGKVGVVGSVKYSVNGGRVEYNTFEVDGSDVLNTGLNGAASTLVVYPSLDAIQEVKVLTSNYGAQFGRTASGTVQVTTRSGSDKIHGNLYEFLRNEVFNSRNYFDQTAHAPLYRRHDFGGTVGGPLSIPRIYNTKKDKTFFFFSEEARLEKSPTQYNQAVPSLKERGLILTPQGIQPNLQPASDGSGRLQQVFDFSDVCPLPGSPESINGFSRQQFPDCPATNPSGSPLIPFAFNNLNGNGFGVNKNALALLYSNLIPLPNSSTGCSFRLANETLSSDPNNPILVPPTDPSDPNHCYNATVSPSTYYREELFRIDHTFNAKTTAMFRYIHDSWDTTVLTPQWGAVRNSFPTVQNRFIGPGTNLVARLTETLTPTLVNEFTASYVNSTITLADRNGPGGARFQRDPSLDQPLVADPNFPGQCNPLVSQDPTTGLPQCAIGHLFNNGFAGKNPGLLFTGTNAAYGGQGFAVDSSYEPWVHSNPIYSVRDDLTKGLGKHTLQFGVQFILSQRNQTNNAIGAATGDQQGLLTFSNLVQSTGNAFADFLVEQNASGRVSGFIQSFTQDSSQRRYYQRYQIAEPYFQDDWKITHRLTLNLGLRISLFGTYHEKNHNAWNFVPSKFDKTAFAVDPATGVLLDATSSAPILLASGNQLSSDVVKKMGLVQCGVGGTPEGCLQGHLFNPAPRIGFAWDPAGDGKTSIRGGYGIFFEHGTGNETNTGSLEGAAPLVLNFTQHFPSNYSCIGSTGLGETVDPSNAYCQLRSPITGNSVPAPPPGSIYPISVTAIPGKAIWPYAQQWSFSIQRQLPRDMVATFAYVGSKGTKLTIEAQRNQIRPVSPQNNPFGPNEPLTRADCNKLQGPNPFVLQSGVQVTPQDPAYPNLLAACTSPDNPDVNSLPRPYPGLGRVLSLENAANSSYHAFQATLRRTKGPLTTGVSYSYSHSIDNSSDRSDPVLANSYDLRANRASSNFDERHLLNVSYLYQLPSFAGRLHGWAKEQEKTDDAPGSGDGSHLFHSLLDGWQLSGITLFQSGTPFSVINGTGNTGISLSDNAGVSSGLGIAPSYPDVVSGLQKPASNSQSFGPLLANPSQFVAPRGLTFGNAGRNFLNNPSRLNFDAALLRHFKIRERGDLEFRAEAFNLFNHTQFRVYDPDNPGIAGNNLISCYAGPVYSAGFKGSAADCVTGASFLHPINAHRPRTLQLGLKLAF